MTARQPASPPEELDLRLLELLYAHRALTTPQAAEATDRPPRTVLHRLTHLRKAGKVDHAQPSATKGKAPLHWWLTSAGRTVLGYPTRVRPEQNSIPFLQHTVAIAAVPLALRKVGPEVGIELVGWLRDEQAWHSVVTPFGTVRITPDGLAVVRLRGQDEQVGLWVEIDRATNSLTRVRGQIRRYLRYSAAEGWQDRHTMCPMLLLLTDSADRAVNMLKAAAEERRDVLGATGELMVAVTDKVNAAEEAIRGRVWLCDNDSAPVSTPLLDDPPRYTLAEKLAYRVSTEQARRSEQADRDAARVDAERDARIDELVTQLRSSRTQLPQGFSVDVLAAALARDGEPLRAWLREHPDQVEALRSWLRRPDNPPDPLADGLQQFHMTLWDEQLTKVEEVVLAGRDDPTLRRILSVHNRETLAPGRLLDALDEPHAFADVQQALLAGYADQKASYVAVKLKAQGPLRRHRAALHQELDEAYDREHLRTCQACGLHHPTEAASKTADCAGCGGALGPYDPARPGQLASDIAELAAELRDPIAAGGGLASRGPGFDAIDNVRQEAP